MGRVGDDIVDQETELDRLFDAGEVDVLSYFDTSKARRINRDTQRFNLDTPAWMVNALDAEANRIGVTRQALVKMWLAERLGQIKATR